MKYIIGLFTLSILVACSTPKEKEIQETFSASFRGVAVAEDGEMWASGTGGEVIYSPHADSVFRSVKVQSDTLADFRSIALSKSGEAHVVAVAEPARIYKTSDAGKSWKQTFFLDTPGIFLDGIAFFDNREGIAFGDPIDNKLVLLKTYDAGETWSWLKPNNFPEAFPGEGGFAASGTSIGVKGNSVWIGTGGPNGARVYRSRDRGISWEVFNTPLAVGDGCGVFSLAFTDEQNGVVVGGCYVDSTNSERTSAYTSDGGTTWNLSKVSVSGYRSVVVKAEDGYYAWGRTGMDFSSDGGATWENKGNAGFFAGAAVAPNKLLMVGRRGKVKLIHQP